MLPNLDTLSIEKFGGDNGRERFTRRRTFVATFFNPSTNTWSSDVTISHVQVAKIAGLEEHAVARAHKWLAQAGFESIERGKAGRAATYHARLPLPMSKPIVRKPRPPKPKKAKPPAAAPVVVPALAVAPEPVTPPPPTLVDRVRAMWARYKEAKKVQEQVQEPESKQVQPTPVIEPPTMQPEELEDVLRQRDIAQLRNDSRMPEPHRSLLEVDQVQETYIGRLDDGSTAIKLEFPNGMPWVEREALLQAYRLKGWKTV